MITSKQEYKSFLAADKSANHISGIHALINKRWQYIKCMRKVEYIKNCKHGILAKIQLKWQQYKLSRLSVETGISIPPNTFGKGLYIPHHGAIVVNGSARFGDNCVIQNGVNVSAEVLGGANVILELALN